MRMPSLFPSRSPATAAMRVRRKRRGVRRFQQRQIGSWERLGFGLGGHEALEQRALMAADLSLSFNDDLNLVPRIERTFSSPGTQVVYTLTVTNSGPDTATDALVKTSLAGSITNKTWTAVYAGGATGPIKGGAGDLGTHTDQKTKTDFGTTVTLPSKASATFTIVGTIPASATGKLTSSASVTLGTDTKTATDENTFVPRSLAVGSNGSWTSPSTVRLVSPVNGGSIAAPVTPYEGLRTGVRAVLADLTGDGKAEVVCVPNYGTAAQIVVYSQNIAKDGSVTLVKNPGYTLAPFGAGYTGGMTVAAGDFDGNGLEDLAFGQSSAEGQVKVYLSKSDQPAAPLALSRTFTPFAGSSGVGAMSAGDFGIFTEAPNGAARRHGKDELVVTSGIGTRAVARVYAGVADSKLSVIDTIKPFGATFNRGFSVEVARLNADSTPDLVFTAASGGGSAVEIYDGTVATAKNRQLAKFAAFSGVGRGSSVFAAAVDGDGDTRAEAIHFVQGGGAGNALVRYDVGIGTAAGSITATRKDSVAAVTGTLRAAAAAIQADPGMIRTSSGLSYKELVKGSGDGFASGKTGGVKVNYQGYNSDGDRFDSGSNVDFQIGSLIAGFTEGLKTMKVGGTSQFVIPAALGYGDSAPSNGKPIIFIVDLLAFT